MPKGFRLSDETKRKIGLANRGRHRSEETRQKISAALKGHSTSPELCKIRSKNAKRFWENPARRIRHGQLMSQILKGRRPSDNTIAASVAYWKGRKHSKESVERMAKTMRFICNTPEMRARRAEIAKKLWANPDFGGHGALKRPEVRAKIAQAQRRCWQNPEYVDRVRKQRRMQPNRAERHLGSILGLICPGEYRFVGDLAFMLGGRNPDFMNINGQKKLIELFGNYWHKGEDPQPRIDHFRAFGFDTLVIWESELKDESKLRERILQWHNQVQ